MNLGDIIIYKEAQIKLYSLETHMDTITMKKYIDLAAHSLKTRKQTQKILWWLIVQNISEINRSKYPWDAL